MPLQPVGAHSRERGCAVLPPEDGGLPVAGLPAGLLPSRGAPRSWGAPSSRWMTGTGGGDEREIKVRVEAAKQP